MSITALYQISFSSEQQKSIEKFIDGQIEELNKSNTEMTSLYEELNKILASLLNYEKQLASYNELITKYEKQINTVFAEINKHVSEIEGIVLVGEMFYQQRTDIE